MQQIIISKMTTAAPANQRSSSVRTTTSLSPLALISIPNLHLLRASTVSSSRKRNGHAGEHCRPTVYSWQAAAAPPNTEEDRRIVTPVAVSSSKYEAVHRAYHRETTAAMAITIHVASIISNIPQQLSDAKTPYTWVGVTTICRILVLLCNANRR